MKMGCLRIEHGNCWWPTCHLTSIMHVIHDNGNLHNKAIFKWVREYEDKEKKSPTMIK